MKKTVQVLSLLAANPRDMCCFNFITDTANDIRHLYFTSNEEIKGDGYYISQQEPIADIYQAKADYKEESQYFSKVIATTDKSLNLPLIPDWFIKKYIELNGNIKEVEVEYATEKNILISYPFGNKTIVISDKKQTLEEAAHDYAKYLPIGIERTKAVADFIAGAKAQKENNW